MLGPEILNVVSHRSQQGSIYLFSGDGERRGPRKIYGTVFFLQLCGFQAWNLGPQVWQGCGWAQGQGWLLIPHQSPLFRFCMCQLYQKQTPNHGLYTFPAAGSRWLALCSLPSAFSAMNSLVSTCLRAFIVVFCSLMSGVTMTGCQLG